jgi:hypothetical protein
MFYTLPAAPAQSQSQPEMASLEPDELPLLLARKDSHSSAWSYDQNPDSRISRRLLQRVKRLVSTTSLTRQSDERSQVKPRQGPSSSTISRYSSATSSLDSNLSEGDTKQPKSGDQPIKEKKEKRGFFKELALSMAISFGGMNPLPAPAPWLEDRYYGVPVPIFY